MMPTVRKLNAEEVQTLERKTKGIRRATEEQYDAYIREYMPGEYGEAVLDENENKMTVRNQLKAAAKRNGLALDFRQERISKRPLITSHSAVPRVQEDSIRSAVRYSQQSFLPTASGQRPRRGSHTE